MSVLSEAVRATFAEARGDAFEIDGRWVSWAEALALTDAVRGALATCRIGPGARVGLIARNRMPQAAGLMALLADDLCAVPLNPFQSEAMLASDVARLGLAAVLGEPADLTEAVRAADPAAGIVALEPAGAQVLRRPSFTDERTQADCAILLPTSGTTGTPKRIPIRPDTWHATLTAGVRNAGKTDVTIQYSPLAHIAGALTVSGAAVRGDRVVLLEKFSVEGWLDAVRRYRPVVASLPPTMMRMVMDADPDPADLASVEVVMSGQAPVDWSLARAFEAKYGVVVCGNYGATEYCGPIAAGSAELRRQFGDSKWGSVGRLRRDLAEARIVHPQTGAAVAAGEAGVLEVKVFRIGSDWMRTSDLARLDADDFLYIEGRADDAIIRGGFKITPDTVADALRAFPGVADVGVAGLPDERLGALPAAAVEMKPGAAWPSEAELIAFARSKLLAYQVPVRVKVVDALPRTPTLKVDRRGLIALLQESGDTY